MGFGEKLVGFIETLYSDARCIVKVGNSLTAPIKVKRGNRQGCPLSGQLYVISTEPFLWLLKTELKGIKLQGTPDIKMVTAAYTDDITIFTSSEEDFSKIEDCFGRYGNISAAKLNSEKCLGLWCGSWMRRMDKPARFRWTTTPESFLEAYLGARLSESTNRMIEFLQEKFSQTLDA